MLRFQWHQCPKGFDFSRRQCGREVEVPEITNYLELFLGNPWLNSTTSLLLLVVYLHTVGNFLLTNTNHNIWTFPACKQRLVLLMNLTAKCSVYIAVLSSCRATLCFAYKLLNSFSRSMFISNLSLIHQRIPRKACCPWSLIIRERM